MKELTILILYHPILLLKTKLFAGYIYIFIQIKLFFILNTNLNIFMNSNKDPTDISCAMHLNMSNFILTIQYITISIFQGTTTVSMIVR